MPLLGKVAGNGITKFQLLETNERTVAHPPGAGLGIVVVEICAQTGPECVEIAIGLAPVVIGYGLEQLGASVEWSLTTLGLFIGSRVTTGINPE